MTNLLLMLLSISLLVMFGIFFESMPGMPDMVAAGAYITLVVLVLALGALGVLRVTLREPTPAMLRKREYVRPIARWGTLAPLLVWFLGSMGSGLFVGRIFLPQLICFMVVLPGGVIAGLICLMIHVRRLAVRDGHRRLWRSVTALGISFLFFGALTVGLAVAESIMLSRSFAAAGATPYAGSAPYVGTSGAGGAGTTGLATSPPPLVYSRNTDVFELVAHIMTVANFLVVLPTCFLGSVAVLLAFRSMFSRAIARAPDVEAPG